jgi:hypothetical protein
LVRFLNDLAARPDGIDGLEERLMRARYAAWLAILVVGCGGGESSPDSGERPRPDAGEPPPTRTGTTAKECFAGIALTPGELEPYMQITRFVTQGGKYQIVRAREKRGGTRGLTTTYQSARVWIDGGDEQGTCVTDANAMTYSTTHHNFDDRYTVTTEHATYAFHESVDFASDNAAWNNTLEVRDAGGSLTEGPLTLLDVCRAEITSEQHGAEIVCNPAEPPLEPGADEDDWEGCPAVNDFPPFREGGGLLAVAEGAVYCAAFRPEQTLQEAFATHAMLRFTPGEYALPTASTADYRMPVCARMRGVSDVLVTRPAQLMHSMEVVDWQDVHRYALDAPPCSAKRPQRAQRRRALRRAHRRRLRLAGERHRSARPVRRYRGRSRLRPRGHRTHRHRIDRSSLVVMVLDSLRGRTPLHLRR